MGVNWHIPSKILALGIKLPCIQFVLYNITSKLFKKQNETEKSTPFGDLLGENITLGLKDVIIHRWDYLGRCTFSQGNLRTANRSHCTTNQAGEGEFLTKQ